MTVIVPEPVLDENNNNNNIQGEENLVDGSLKLDGGFSVPDNNAYGHSFRDYEKESERRASVEEFYRTNHIYQTFDFANKKKEEYGKLNRAEMSIWECCELLNEFVDESDPDLDEPQIEHLLQTAEAIRRDYPNEGWLHLTALIHDLGKVLLHPSFGGEPQWCVVAVTAFAAAMTDIGSLPLSSSSPPLSCCVAAATIGGNITSSGPPPLSPLPSGFCWSREIKKLFFVLIYVLIISSTKFLRGRDSHLRHGGRRNFLHQPNSRGDTFPLGCAFHESVVHHQYFKENPDYSDPVYSTRLGVYEENCGLDKVTMSWGHDEYMYLVMKENRTSLPPAALFIVRFHSFYALHRAGAYTYLMNDDDKEMLKWLHIFNKYDLYSKSKVRINQEEVKPYYLSLISKYFPEKLRW